MQLVVNAIAHTAIVLNSIVVNQGACIYGLTTPCDRITRADGSILNDGLSTQYGQVQGYDTITTSKNACKWLGYSSIRVVTTSHLSPYVWCVRFTDGSIDHGLDLITDGQVESNDHTVATCKNTCQSILIDTCCSIDAIVPEICLAVADSRILNGCLLRLCHLEGVSGLEYVITLILYNESHCMVSCTTRYCS